jgi:CHAT domain-containing protein
LGLPASFLAAGVPAVVSTLWAVRDVSAMLLMERFYQLYLRDGLHPRVALRAAQLWLRDVTCGELAARFEAEKEKPEAERILPDQEASEAWQRFSAHEPTQRPFLDPSHWAAFVYTGE